MIIDWYTIIFQIINFLILVFLLRYFLYGPVTRVMNEREAKILQREKTAAEEKQKAEEAAKSYRIKIGELENREEELKEKAMAAAVEEKSRLIEEARHDAEDKRRQWEEELAREKEAFSERLRRGMAEQACRIARRCLDDLSDVRLESLTWDYFVKKLASLTEEERSELDKAFSGKHRTIFLHSAFEPPEGKISDLKNALKNLLSHKKEELNVSLKNDPALICGLELDVGGYSISWSIDSYMQGVEEQILQELERGTLQGSSREGS